MIVNGKFPLDAGHKVSKQGYEVEAYNTKRYFTVTGHRLESYPVDVVASPEAETLYKELFGKPNPPASAVVSTPSQPTPVMSFDQEETRIRSALAHINADDYETWLHMGFALKFWEGEGAESRAKTLWDEWSKKSAKFQQDKNDCQWQHFDSDGPLVTDSQTGVQSKRSITLGTLFKLARKKTGRTGNCQRWCFRLVAAPSTMSVKSWENCWRQPVASTCVGMFPWN